MTPTEEELMQQHLSSCDLLVVSDIVKHNEYVRQHASTACLQAFDELLLLVDDALQVGGIEFLEEALLSFCFSTFFAKSLTVCHTGSM